MIAPAGELPLQMVRLLTSLRCEKKGYDLRRAGPGFTLPANIGDFGPDNTELDLGGWNLIGPVCHADIRWRFFLQ